MPDSVDTAATQRIEGALALLRERAPEHERDALLAFAQAYLSGVDAEDLRERDVLDLYGAVRSLWQFAGTREPGQPKVRVFNPSVDEHGWQSTHTVVEIVNDDMPFLVDSMQMELQRQRLTLHFIAHPIVECRATAPRASPGPRRGAARRESLMHIEVDRLAEPGRRNALAADIVRVLGDVRPVVTDWSAMRERMLADRRRARQRRAAAPPEEIGETRAFLHWLADDHFTFVGYRCYDAVDGEDGLGLAIDRARACGLLRPQPARRVPRASAAAGEAAREGARAGAADRHQGELAGDGAPSGATSTASGSSASTPPARSSASTASSASSPPRPTAVPCRIPLLRRKIARTLELADLPPNSHDAKAMVQILETFPRDEMFQIAEDELLEMGLGILQLQERHRIAVFTRKDPYGASSPASSTCRATVTTPRSARRSAPFLEEAYQGEQTAVYTQVGDAPLARAHFVIATKPGQVPDVDPRRLEAFVADAARTWSDHLRDALVLARGEEEGVNLHRRYRDAFPTAYREAFAASAAVADARFIEDVLADGGVEILLYRDDTAEGPRCKLFHAGAPVALSEACPGSRTWASRW